MVLWSYCKKRQSGGWPFYKFRVRASGPLNTMNPKWNELCPPDMSVSEDVMLEG